MGASRSGKSGPNTFYDTVKLTPAQVKAKKKKPRKADSLAQSEGSTANQIKVNREKKAAKLKEITGK